MNSEPARVTEPGFVSRVIQKLKSVVSISFFKRGTFLKTLLGRAGASFNQQTFNQS